MLRGRTGEARSLNRTAPSKALDERTERAEGLPDASTSSLSSATCITQHDVCLMAEGAEGWLHASTSSLFNATCTWCVGHICISFSTAEAILKSCDTVAGASLQAAKCMKDAFGQIS